MCNRFLVVSALEADVRYLQAIRGEHLAMAGSIGWAANLYAALEQLAVFSAVLIIADCNLPDSQGMSTLARLREAAPRTPILTLHDDAADPLAQAARQNGASAYLIRGAYAHYLLSQTVEQILARRALEDGLLTQRARAEITLASIEDAVVTTGSTGVVDYMNAAASVLTGWPQHEALGLPVDDVLQFLNKDNLRPIRNPLTVVLERNHALRLPAGTILIRRDGSEAAIEDSSAPIHTPGGELAGAVIVFHDVGDAQDMIAQMAHLSTHDVLTDLPNRAALQARISHAVAMGQRDRLGFSVLYLGLDNFKHVNDALGHGIGDKLLCSVAARLAACVRASDTISRLGGDEFVLLVLDTFARQDAIVTANKLLNCLSRPHRIDQHELHISASIGISQFPDNGSEPSVLVQQAAAALSGAKDKGRNTFQFFESTMNARAVERQRVESNLRYAIEREELVLFYQPKVDLGSGKLIGAEALLRWRHPDWGLVPPERFIQVAEDFGLIVPMGRWVLRQACLQARRWQQAGWPIDTMAVNVSAVEFKRHDFVQGVQDILAVTGLQPCCLELEITESVLMHDAEASRAILEQLKAMGIRVAMDDFGTGYSSLSYLKRFPIDVIKIDRSFVSGIGTDQDDGSIATAVIAMGSSLHYRVVAEGVEDRFQLDFLRERHCHEAQGYYFSAPLAADAFEHMLGIGDAYMTPAA